MGFALEKQMCLFALLVLLFPLLCTSQDPFTLSRATYYGSPDYYGHQKGTCGFGEYGRTVNDGNVAGVGSLYRNGSGCGACYQVRCTNKQYCSDDGVDVVATDYGVADRTDFILSPRAYANLASSNLAFELELFADGVVDVEYRRISCQHPGYNLMYKVGERSKYRRYLAIVILYVAGQNDITAVELWQEDSKQWRPMRRAFGAIWELQNPPKGSIKLRLQMSCSTTGVNWVENDNAIPDNWIAGAVYDSTIQFT